MNYPAFLKELNELHTLALCQPEDAPDKEALLRKWWKLGTKFEGGEG